MQGFVPTLLEDVPDMAVKFAVYESLRSLHRRVFRGQQVPFISCILLTERPAILLWKNFY